MSLVVVKLSPPEVEAARVFWEKHPDHEVAGHENGEFFLSDDSEVTVGFTNTVARSIRRGRLLQVGEPFDPELPSTIAHLENRGGAWNISKPALKLLEQFEVEGVVIDHDALVGTGNKGLITVADIKAAAEAAEVTTWNAAVSAETDKVTDSKWPLGDAPWPDG